jgi:hypothetical protein
MSAMRCPLFLLLMLSCLTAGCHHAGTAPPGWRGEPLLQSKDAPPEHAAAVGNGAGNDDRPTGTLQVFICYGGVLSNHTALRLEAPGVQSIMWDPGGTYKQDDPAYARRYDVLTKNAPTVEEWWRYRRDSCREPIMEVFQWTLDAEHAQRLHTILLSRHDPADPSQVFEPDAGGLECCKRVCEFLSRFAGDRPAVPVRYFWPHKLGEHLWTQQPDRVMVFRRDGESQAYRRDTNSAVGE